MVQLSIVAGAATLLLWAFRRSTGSIANGLLLTFVAIELIAVIQIEVLSAFAAYRPLPVTILWALVAVGAYLWGRRMPGAASLRFSWNRWEWAVGVACVVLLAGTLVAALWGTPNTWDALTYHLPRAMNWIQHGSIANFPTSAARQLKMPPMAEILVSQTILLSRGDRLVNLVQWGASGVTALAIYAIVRGAGLSRLAGLNGALLFLSMPMVLLQASGPKNDLVLCANLAVAIAFFRRGYGELAWRWLIPGAAALGLAILTKGTALVFGGLLAAILVAAVLRRHGVKSSLGVAAFVALAILSINANHWSRNLREFGSPLGPVREDEGYEYGNQRIDGGTLLSNLLRNTALHLETPSTALNRRIESAVTAAHVALGLRIDDPATTWPEARLELLGFPGKDEDRSGNPLQFLLIVSALVAAPRALRTAEHRRFGLAIACVLLAASAAFCLLFKWQIWHARLHLPLFVAGCVLVALVGWRLPRSLAITLFLVATASIPSLLENSARPLVGKNSVLRHSRTHNLFRHDEIGGRRLGHRLSELGVSRVGLRLYGEDPEYLVWNAAKMASPSVTLVHVAAQYGQETAGPPFPPIKTVVTYGEPTNVRLLWLEGHAYHVDRRCGRFTVWRLRRSLMARASSDLRRFERPRRSLPHHLDLDVVWAAAREAAGSAARAGDEHVVDEGVDGSCGCLAREALGGEPARNTRGGQE